MHRSVVLIHYYYRQLLLLSNKKNKKYLKNLIPAEHFRNLVQQSENHLRFFIQIFTLEKKKSCLSVYFQFNAFQQTNKMRRKDSRG